MSEQCFTMQQIMLYFVANCNVASFNVELKDANGMAWLEAI